jgi:signal transduction histidine kinase
MKSIRVSLIVYFLALLGVAWAAVSWFAYDSATQNLRAKQDANRDLLKKEYDERCHQEKEHLDDRLLAKASIVAHYMQTQIQWEQTALARTVLLGITSEGQAHLSALLWMYQSSTARYPGTPFIPTVTRKLVTQIKIKDNELPSEPREGDGPFPAEYFQIDSDVGVPWPPVPPGGHALFKPDTFDPNRLIESKLDDVVMPSGKTVRRLQLKFSPTRQQFSLPRRRGPSTNASTSDSTRPERPPVQPGAPWFVIHCALEPIQRDNRIAALKLEYGQLLADQDEMAHNELARLRRTLLLIGLGAFSATALGGYLLVGFGLSPLKRLSEAVSQVSPRDFKLPLNDDSMLGTELAPVADHLRQTLEQLRSAFEREKQAAADISHELRTPVASLLAMLDVALRKPRTADEYRQTLVECRAVGGQMRQLVERLMALARLDAGSDHVRPTEFDIGELVGEVTTMVKPLAGERGVDLRVNCPEDVTWKTDPDKLREILVNLLHNAIQYNRPNGSIDVTAATENGWLDLRVRDTGIGIDAKTSERIFERFYRADPSRNESGLHAGLGLSIVKGYVRLLGGTISVESQAGKGSTFLVRLPKNLAA